MKYEEFMEQVLQAVRERVGGDVQVGLQKIQKNNGTEKAALSFRREGSTVCPLIYLEGFYESYQADGETAEALQKVVNDVEHEREKYNYEMEVEKIAETFSNLDRWKDAIIFRLINRERNGELLEERAYVPFLDLAAELLVYVGEGPEGFFTVPLRKEHIQKWGVTEEYLYELAKKNTARIFPAQIETMNTLLEKLLGELWEELEDVPEMYILYNQRFYCGAATLLYDGQLERIAQKLQSDFIVLPSSIHEVLLLPFDSIEEVGLDEWKDTVGEINREDVRAEDWLSDHVYVYRRETGALEIAV